MFFNTQAQDIQLDYSEMEHFVHKKMKMTHVYQPLMIKTLLESGSLTATVEDIARRFVGIDIPVLDYYKKIVKRWPHKTLKSHNVVEYDRRHQSYRLLLDSNTSQGQIDRLVELCDLRLKEFIDRDRWIRTRHQRAERSSLGSLRYDILAKSKATCVACGIKSTEAFLHVDHIVPIACGGPDTPENMQALCDRCNQQKRDRDDTDFLLWHKQMQFARSPKCRLCNGRHKTLDNRLAYAVMGTPSSDYTSFVTPVRHVGSLVEMIPAEKQLCLMLVDQVIENLKRDFPKTRFGVTGLDSSDATHCQIHIRKC